MDMMATLLKKKKQMKYLLINSDYLQAYSECSFNSEEVKGGLVLIIKSNKSECSYLITPTLALVLTVDVKPQARKMNTSYIVCYGTSIRTMTRSLQ